MRRTLLSSEGGETLPTPPPSPASRAGAAGTDLFRLPGRRMAGVRNEQLLEQQVVDPNWGTPLPGGEQRLSRWTVLEYFCNTTMGIPGFYDASCCNEEWARSARGQAELARFNAQEAELFQPGRWSYDAFVRARRHRLDTVRQALRSLRGKQFDVIDHLCTDGGDHTLFIIQACERQDERTVLPIALYTIIDAIIMRVPDWMTIIDSRVSKCAFHLHHILRIGRELQQLADIGGKETEGDNGEEGAEMEDVDTRS